MIATIKEWINKALALLDQALAILRVKMVFFKSTSPPVAPKLWIYINGASCMLTGMFFLLGCLRDKTLGFQFADLFYIPFNLVICLVWFIEASGWMIFDEEEPAWHKIGELLLSMFFILDGVLWVYEWAFTDLELQRREILIYTAIDFFIYLFYLVLAIRAEAKVSMQAESDPEKGEGNAEAAVVVEPLTDKKEAKADFKLMT